MKTFIEISRAAEILNVSTEFVQDLINNSILSVVKNQNSILLFKFEVYNYKEKLEIETEMALDELSKLTQEMSLDCCIVNKEM